jgi:hypothetical protein
MIVVIYLFNWIKFIRVLLTNTSLIYFIYLFNALLVLSVI